MSNQSNDTTDLTSDFIHDDKVFPFHAELASARGRVVRLGRSIDDLLKKHSYPEPVSQLLGEAVVLAIMLGSSLKFEGKLILQTKTDGPVDMLVTQYKSDGSVRGYARFDEQAISRGQNGHATGADDMLGNGHLVMTIDQGADMERYQGIVAIEAEGLVSVAQKYFEQSEQLQSFLKIAVAKHYVASEEKDSSENWSWRAGGLIVQDISKQGGVDNIAEHDEDSWNRICHLSATLEDHELLDPRLHPQELIYRLFHQESVRVFDESLVQNKCSCSRGQILNVLKQFSEKEKQDMVQDGKIIVTCEFCSSEYVFSPDEA